MKKTFLNIILFGFSFFAFAGEPINRNNYLLCNQADDGDCYDEKTHIINVGLGFGSRTYHSIHRGAGYNYVRTPAISVSYEHPWPKKLGPGFLGVGAYFGFQHENYNYTYNYVFGNTYYYKHKWNHYMIGGRAAYHWDVVNYKNAELYAGVIIGLRIQTDSYDTNDPNPNNDPYTYSQGFAYPAYSVFAGARWYFAKNVGLFAEVGYGISYANAGMSVKF